jgi:hypothetical protein
MPGIPKAKVKSRIVLTPQHAVIEQLERIFTFEQAHGEIKDTEQPPIPLNLVQQDKYNFIEKAPEMEPFFVFIFFLTNQ